MTPGAAPAPPGDPLEAGRALLARLAPLARAQGFTRLGVAPPQVPPAEHARLAGWIARGAHADMDWLARDAPARCDASTLLPGARAVLVGAVPYAAPPERPADGAGRALVATYAQGARDYHRVVGEKTGALFDALAALRPDVRARRFCDTSPLLERAFFVAAGLGFVGKNTLVIDPARGSSFLIAGVVVDCALPLGPVSLGDGLGDGHGGPAWAGPDAAAPGEPPSCGTCTRCLDACPTAAFPAPWVLDAGRCLSYLTIERRGAWPEDLRAQAGAWVFGCDVCQAVCPWTRKFAPPPAPGLEPAPARADPPLVALARRARASFKGVARRNAFERPGRRGLLRNLATALGNALAAGALPAGAAPDGAAEARALLALLLDHDDPGVVEHARWALDRAGPAPPGEPGDAGAARAPTSSPGP